MFGSFPKNHLFNYNNVHLCLNNIMTNPFQSFLFHYHALNFLRKQRINLLFMLIEIVHTIYMTSFRFDFLRNVFRQVNINLYIEEKKNNIKQRMKRMRINILFILLCRFSFARVHTLITRKNNVLARKSYLEMK